MRVKELNGSHIGAKVLIVDQKNHIQIEGLLRNIEHSGNGRLIYGELGARMMIHNLTTVISIGTVDKIYIDPEGEAQVEAESIRRHLLKKVLAITVALEQSTRAVKSMLNSMHGEMLSLFGLGASHFPLPSQSLWENELRK